uniref:Uncharacterized protein n=1 Tax=Arundo donax TaxID=35708 RepID=A0A0A9H539_ARUDO
MGLENLGSRSFWKVGRETRTLGSAEGKGEGG